jgi:anion-transporting  ArsA/GET3 family ATPase
MSPGELKIESLVAKRNILITCGTGGVGKTTLSAAIGIRAAMAGRKTAVVTIDPAKRLATSLGMSELGDHPTDLTPLLRKIHGKEKVPGTLAAIVPETRHTFEAMVSSLMPDARSAERVLKNPIFQIFAREFSGANEYMALERLYALYRVGHYDCIVLDTPPSRNTLAFLDAPTLLNRLFEERLIHWLATPANKLVSAGVKKALSVLEKLTGAGFMTHLFEFASALFEVRLAFAANLKKITALLESEQVGFLLAATPSPETTPEIGHFLKAVRSHRLHFEGIILNRTLSYLKVDSEEKGARKDAALDEALKIVESIQVREEKAISDLLRQIDQELSEGSGEGASFFLAKLPELARDVHSLGDLSHIALEL